MKKVKKLFALLLCLLLLFTACAPPPNCDAGHTDANEDLICDICDEELEEVDSFLPVLRFAITSDVHVRSTKNDYGS